MKFTRRHLCRLPDCYAAGSVTVNGRLLLLLAPDAPGPCYGFDSETFELEEIWQEPGGTMSFVSLPDTNSDFLAVQQFFPGYRAEGTKIVKISRRNGQWTAKSMLELPYLHRFDILRRGGVSYLFCATLCGKKQNEADWSSPGGLYAAVLAEDFSGISSPVQIAGGMTRNHGYWRVENRRYTSALTSCDEGVFEVIPPSGAESEWTVVCILRKPTSDIALCDIDGDGNAELATIEPFHGNLFTIYRQTAQGYEPFYRYPERLEFCHVVWGGTLRGRNVFIGGGRGGKKELFLLQWNGWEIVPEVLEAGAGPANIHIVPGKERDLLLIANHEAGEGAVYIVTD